jgi:hypothetical protein
LVTVVVESGELYTVRVVDGVPMEAEQPTNGKITNIASNKCFIKYPFKVIIQ